MLSELIRSICLLCVYFCDGLNEQKIQPCWQELLLKAACNLGPNAPLVTVSHKHRLYVGKYVDTDIYFLYSSMYNKIYWIERKLTSAMPAKVFDEAKKYANKMHEKSPKIQATVVKVRYMTNLSF